MNIYFITSPSLETRCMTFIEQYNHHKLKTGTIQIVPVIHLKYKFYFGYHISDSSAKSRSISYSWASKSCFSKKLREFWKRLMALIGMLNDLAYSISSLPNPLP